MIIWHDERLVGQSAKEFAEIFHKLMQGRNRKRKD